MAVTVQGVSELLQMVLYFQCHFIIPKSKQAHAYKEAMMMITGAELFVKALKAEQVDTLFAYPGGQAIDLFNALYGELDIDVISFSRHCRI